MSRSHFGVGRVMHFIVLIALACGLTVQTAAQTAKPAATQQTTTRSGSASDEKAPPPGERALVDPVTGQLIGPTAAYSRGGEGPQPIDPSRVMPKPDATGPAPGLEIGMPSPVTFHGNVGPGGTPIGQDAPSSPGGPVRVMDAATERLGPGGTVAQTPTSQPLTPGAAATPSQPARKDGQQQPAKKPGLSNDGGPVGNKPAAQGGMHVVIDPKTGQVVEPTEAQLLELEQQHQQAGELGEPPEVVERPGLESGMVADVPRSLFPLVKATIGPDGQVTIQESQAQGEAAAAMTPGPGGEQRVRSEAAQRLGPAGDQNLDLPPPADVTVTIVNLDGAGEGFNDPTAVAPVFGNPGTTRGAQRLNAFRAAAEYWGAILKSTVPIRVDAKMDPQFCTATSATLGSAGPNTVHRDFAGAPVAATWYVQAVANSRAGVDLDAQSDISATFNSDIDNPTCLGATSWWYGIGAPAPAGTIDFYTVVQHEIGHGIGVLSLVNLSTGAKFVGFDDAYERWLWDWNTGGWPAMTNAQRLASSVNTGQVIFWGSRATEAARGFLSVGLNLGYPQVYAPNPVQPGSSISHWDTVATPNELMEPAITPPPGPYVYLTGGLLEDVGWLLLSNGVFDYGGSGTWTWNPTNGFSQPTGANPSYLEPWNGNFVGIYPGSGTWLWNGTTASLTQLTSAIPDQVKACGNNLLWAGAAFGTWRWNTTTGWAQLTTANPQSMQCFGGNMAWEWAAGTWLYDFSTGWSQITGADPTAMLPCGSRLVWWAPGSGTWYYTAAGWTQITAAVPQSTACYRGKVAWEGAAARGFMTSPRGGR